jgi:FkbM family methyltransferase
MVRPGSMVIDVGCYSGIFAISAKLLGAELAVGLEPMPNLVQRIHANAKLNGVSVQVLEGAASDEDGYAALTFNAGVAFTAGATLEKEALGSTPRKMKVRTFKLDSLNVPISCRGVSAIKIDVEGHELSVLRGALKMIWREKPKLLVEVLNPQQEKAVREMLTPLGYHGNGALLDGRNLLMERKP